MRVPDELIEEVAVTMDVVDIIVGNYQATRILGQGGFATVYLGEHKRLHTNVAIKILKAHLSQRDQQQFLTEARVLAQLRHPNIVEVLDFGIADGSPYLVMHYLARGSLREHYMRGKVYTIEHLLPHIKQIALALQHAHDQKTIHRDVKPENVLVGDNEEAILSDFGIAVLNAESHRQSRQDIAGTLPYMAPEQIKGFPRRSSDQYALAVMTYEWLCGSRPFIGNGIEQMAQQHVEAVPPPLREKVPTISPLIEAVVLKALSKMPEDLNSDHEAQLLANFFKKASLNLRLTPGSCALLCPSERAGKALADALRVQGLEATFMSGQDLNLARSGVKVLTLNAAKGLEFPSSPLRVF